MFKLTPGQIFALAKAHAARRNPVEDACEDELVPEDSGPSGLTKRQREEDHLSQQRAKTRAKHSQVKRREKTITALSGNVEALKIGRDGLQSRLSVLEDDHTGLEARHV
jgi:predicted RNase H-like nuclease (RuvC/YqgF family)